MKAVLRTTDLCKTFLMGDQSVRALDHVNLELPEGEFIAIMGPSGSGKSTLLHILGAMDQPTSGQVFLADRDLSQLSDKELSRVRRQSYGFVFQAFNLLPLMTVRENVAMPLLLDGHKLSAHQARIQELLELVGLKGRENHRPSQLSGGQQQRVAIARALVNDPELILADEPTGALDSKTGAEILSLLRNIVSEHKRTVVMVTHDPRVSQVADRVINVADGRIVEQVRGGARAYA